MFFTFIIILLNIMIYLIFCRTLNIEQVILLRKTFLYSIFNTWTEQCQFLKKSIFTRVGVVQIGTINYDIIKHTVSIVSY